MEATNTGEKPYTADEIENMLPGQPVLGLRDISGVMYELAERGTEQYKLIYEGILKSLEMDAAIECREGDVFINHFWVIPACKRCGEG